MDRSKWERTLTCFQASARGYLVRKEVRRARQDFEDIVKEIDGDLTHLEWRETVVPVPRFTHNDGPVLRASSTDRQHLRPGPDVGAGSQSPSAAAASHSSEGRRGHQGQRTEAERDDSHPKDRFPSCDVGGDAAGSVGDKDGGVAESTGDSTTVWSSLEVDVNFGHKGSRQYHLAQEVPCTPDALRLHRNTLTMELLWLQQAIDSRKKYLSLKDRLSVS